MADWEGMEPYADNSDDDDYYSGDSCNSMESDDCDIVGLIMLGRCKYVNVPT